MNLNTRICILPIINHNLPCRHSKRPKLYNSHTASNVLSVKYCYKFIR